MPTYLVRVKETRELVGFFSVSVLSEMFWLTDQVCDPFAFEIAKLPTGGLYWDSGAQAVPIPQPKDDNADPVMLSFAKATLTEEWEGLIRRDDDLRWRDLATTCGTPYDRGGQFEKLGAGAT